MFGYVRPSAARLTEEDQRRFGAVYCGLCRQLGERYGQAARMILNYDFTFLAVLLWQGEVPEPIHRGCVAHPFAGRDYVPGNDALALAADESVILAWWQAQDALADPGKGKTKYRAASLALKGAYRRARPEKNGQVGIANRIFEMYLLNLFMTEEAVKSEVYLKGDTDRIGFIKGNRLDMDLILKKFVEYFTEICNEKDAAFVEKNGRKFFLLYLKPIINGTGNYYLEAQTRDARRTNVIVDYLGGQFIIELKIWHGSEYNERGEQQLMDYLEYYHKDKGYMLSFNFNQRKEIGVKEIRIGNRTIVEAVV